MRYYMVGLLLSYLFWPNHYAILRFLKEHLPTISAEHYLEVAPGHGLFTVEAVRQLPRLDATLVDISETSLQVTQSLLETFEVEPRRIQFVQGDFLTAPLEIGNFDFIMMGEVLEHVDDAPGLMARAAQLLSSSGTICMTTCANCPAIDHVYHFHNVDEIRSLIRAAGLSIVRDVVLPLDDIPESRWQEELNTINYAAILEKQPYGKAY
jgi:ubiquinone/menaquinone biosynthesis C-methylase UbiE